MSLRIRFLLGILILAALCSAVLGVDYLQRRAAAASGTAGAGAGSIPIYLDGLFTGSFTADDLAPFPRSSFNDAEEGKEQSGWLLRDAVELRVQGRSLGPGSTVTVSSSSRQKSVQMSWAEAGDPANLVILAVSGRGTLKLVAKQGTASPRDRWVQDVDRIEVTSR